MRSFALALMLVLSLAATPRRELAALERTGVDRRLLRNRPARTMERHRERRVESAGARPRHFVADRVGRSGVRDVANRPQRAARGKSSDARAGRQPLGSRRTGARWQRRGRQPAKSSFLVTALSRVDGRKLWEYELPAEGQLAEVHDKHNLASSSPVTDGRRVYAWFGTGQIVSLDMSGKLVWSRHLGREYCAVRHQLGPQQLSRDLQRLAVPHLLSRHRLVSAESRRGVGQNEVARRSRRHVQLVQHAARRASRAARTS